MQDHQYHSRVEIYVAAGEAHEYTPSDVGLFLYDFDSLYELVRLALDPSYQDFQFSRFVLYRNHPRLKPEDKMQAALLKLRSPLEILNTINTVLASAAPMAAVILTLVNILETTHDRSLKRRKLELEVAKLARDTDTDVSAVPTADAELESLKNQRDILLPSEDQVREILRSAAMHCSTSKPCASAFPTRLLFPPSSRFA